MKLNMAVLCDRATVREGLLHILGAGVTQVSVVLPNPPDLDLAILLSSETWNEFAGRHPLTVSLTNPDGSEVGKVELVWEGPQIDTPPEADAQPLPQLPLVVPLRGLRLQHQGEHHVSIAVDGTEITKLSFTVTKAELAHVTSQFH